MVSPTYHIDTLEGCISWVTNTTLWGGLRERSSITSSCLGEGNLSQNADTADALDGGAQWAKIKEHITVIKINH